MNTPYVNPENVNPHFLRPAEFGLVATHVEPFTACGQTTTVFEDSENHTITKK